MRSAVAEAINKYDAQTGEGGHPKPTKAALRRQRRQRCKAAEQGKKPFKPKASANSPCSSTIGNDELEA